jgi:hypothetical protein
MAKKIISSVKLYVFLLAFGLEASQGGVSPSGDVSSSDTSTQKLLQHQ